MVCIVILALIVILTLFYLCYYFIVKKGIEKAATVKKALKKRESLRITAIVLFIIISLLSIIELLAYVFEPFPEAMRDMSFVKLIFYAIHIGFTFLSAALFDRVRKDGAFISALTSEDLLNEETDFALYLRGFENDIYDLDKTEFQFRRFSEHYLAQVVERGLNLWLYAIGHPKETTGPEGAMRVYVEQNEWKESVFALMKRAKMIFIQVNDRESCLWELQQCDDILDKCVFIITNKEKFFRAYKSLQGCELFKSMEDNLDMITDDGPYYFSASKPLKKFRQAWLAYNDMAGVDPPVQLGDDPENDRDYAALPIPDRWRKKWDMD